VYTIGRIGSEKPAGSFLLRHMRNGQQISLAKIICESTTSLWWGWYQISSLKEIVVGDEFHSFLHPRWFSIGVYPKQNAWDDGEVSLNWARSLFAGPRWEQWYYNTTVFEMTGAYSHVISGGRSPQENLHYRWRERGGKSRFRNPFMEAVLRAIPRETADYANSRLTGGHHDWEYVLDVLQMAAKFCLQNKGAKRTWAVLGAVKNQSLMGAIDLLDRGLLNYVRGRRCGIGHSAGDFFKRVFPVFKALVRALEKRRVYARGFTFYNVDPEHMLLTRITTTGIAEKFAALNS